MWVWVRDYVELYFREADVPRDKRDGVVSGIDYAAVKECLEKQFAPSGLQLEWQRKFHTGQQEQAESLIAFSARLRMLVDKAYPSWPAEERLELVRNQFIHGILSPSIQLKLLQQNLDTLDAAIELACRLESVESAQSSFQTAKVAAGVTETRDGSEEGAQPGYQDLVAQVKSLSHQLDTLRRGKQTGPRSFRVRLSVRLETDSDVFKDGRGLFEPKPVFSDDHFGLLVAHSVSYVSSQGDTVIQLKNVTSTPISVYAGEKVGVLSELQEENSANTVKTSGNGQPVAARNAIDKSIGKRSAVLRALNLIEELGPHIGLVINFSKCEVFSPQGNHLFPPAVKSSLSPNLEILGVPIGDYLHCSHFIAENCSKAKVLFPALVEVAEADLHVAVSLLRICGSYCKLVHLARTTPPSLSCESLKFFDEEVRHCFSTCIAADIPDDHWKQAQLSLSFGGLGFLSLSYHSCAAFISSLSSSGFGSASNRHLLSAISKFNALVSPTQAIKVESVLSSPLSQHALCKKLDDHHFHSWLSVVPSLGLGLHLDPAEFQIAVMWWLVSCRHGGDVVIRHNCLRNIFAEFCRRAHLSVRVEVGQGLSRVQSNSRPADVLVDACDRVLQLTKQSAESTPKVSGAGVRVCFPLAVESYGNWGKEAQNTFARLASILSISLHCPKAKVLIEIYGRLNISLVSLQDPQMTSLLPEWPYSSSLQDPQMTSLLPEWPYSSSLRDPQMTSLLPEWLYSSSLRDPQMTSLLPEWPYSSSLRDPQMTTKG
ncbi:hypothetical protein EMCRGX_G022523 [Ephydatia muelleri]